LTEALTSSKASLVIGIVTLTLAYPRHKAPTGYNVTERNNVLLLHIRIAALVREEAVLRLCGLVVINPGVAIGPNETRGALTLGIIPGHWYSWLGQANSMP
jgi:hypothetical protein